MRSMVIDRRSLLLGAGGLALAGRQWRRAEAASRGTLYLSGRADESGGFHLSAFDGSGERRLDLLLPARGHHVTVRPDGRQCVMVARRPGKFLVVGDLLSGRLAATVAAAGGRRFCGHGCFSADGRFYFTTENDYDGGRGVIGVHDVTDGYRRVGEWPSHGIGPHQLALMPDQRTLVVANGGILTHPERARDKLNLATMAPALTYIDSRSGERVGEVRLAAELHQLSIRHLAVAPDGTVAFGMQYEGPRNDRVPLVGLHDGTEVRLLTPPDGDWRAMRQYCGSIAFDGTGTTIAATSPRGGTVFFRDRASGSGLGRFALADGCGTAPTGNPGEFILTSGLGRAIRVTPARGLPVELNGPFVAGSRWDNHLTYAPAA